jgi:Mg-chelatase subunit ChlD
MQKDDTGIQSDMMSKAGLTLTHSLATPVIPTAGEARLVYAILEIKGSESKESLPVNIGFIIDVSDSMRIRQVSDDQFASLVKQGNVKEVMTDGVPAYQITNIPNEFVNNFLRRIDSVSEALIIASEFLRVFDRFSVTAFADQAFRLIPSSNGSEKSHLFRAARELEHLHLGNGTNMAAGLASAFDEMHHYSNNKYASRLILLTDGHTRDVSECYTWAKKAQEAGIPLTTMGIGSEFNEELLIPLADLTGGNTYYIETHDQIPDLFKQELGVAFRISYRHLAIDLDVSDDVKLRRVYRVLPEIGDLEHNPQANNHYLLPIGNFDPGMPLTLLLEFLIPPWRPGMRHIAKATLSWENASETFYDKQVREDIDLQISENSTIEENKRVLNIVEKVGAYKFGTHALEEAMHSANKNTATIRLRQAATRLLDLGEHSLAGELSRQANSLEQAGQIDPNLTKKLRYETRRIAVEPNE